MWQGLFELADPNNGNLFEAEESKMSTVVTLGCQEPLGQKVPRQRIFVRACYKQLFAKIWKLYDSEQRVTVTLTGTPGIGKSLFGLLFLIELIRFLRHNKASSATLASGLGLELDGRIVYEHVQAVEGDAAYYLVNSTTGAVTKQYAKPEDWLDDPKVFLIKDGPCKIYDVSCQVLWVSSPRAGSFQKASELGKNTLIMPPWTADELVECWRADCAPANLFPMPTDDFGARARIAGKEAVDALDEALPADAKDEAVLRRWAADLGPVARRVFGPSVAYVSLDAALRHDMYKEDLEKLVDAATSQDAGGESSRFKTSHRLLLMFPSKDFSTYEFIPSSVKIGHTILRKSLRTDLKQARTLIGKLTGTNRGLVFEPYAHYMLSKAGGRFTIRSLQEDGKEEQLELPVDSATVEVDNKDVMDLVLDDRYYLPTDPCFSVVDSWTKLDMFQMTVGLSHPIKSTSKQFTALKGKGPERIIFVVPKDIAGNFQRQPLVLANGKLPANSCGGPKGGWNDLPQFVLAL